MDYLKPNNSISSVSLSSCTFYKLLVLQYEVLQHLLRTFHKAFVSNQDASELHVRKEHFLSNNKSYFADQIPSPVLNAQYYSLMSSSNLQAYGPFLQDEEILAGAFVQS
ncbi:hypothetical protein [Coconut foliar decay alphasatellite 7]|uniref:Uncharacterized protein n=1 Tax=Coconut foliar decay alphasatellite 7 TaxID=2161880 RepID=A0A2R4N9C1_9VIRU|nr:hypothetical protein [Coconut foliar decay alphasatellite 7]AVX29437.1 hypothetical protein [Coconut foliar decay alphasatellite 7]